MSKNSSCDGFLITLDPGRSYGTSWRRKIDDSSVYLDLRNSTFQGTVGVSVYGRDQEIEINCTNRAPSFQLSSGNKYLLYNLVHENRLTEAKLLFILPNSRQRIEIHGNWSPDSNDDDGCIIVTGRDSAYNTQKNNYDRNFSIESGVKKSRTPVEHKLDKTSIFLDLENSHFSGTAKVSIMGWGKDSKIQNFTNQNEYFLVESGKKYFLYNQVKENYYNYAFLEFEKQNENDVIQGKWSPDSTPDSSCIVITGGENAKKNTYDRNFTIESGQKTGQTSVEPKYNKSSIYLNLQNSHFMGSVKVFIMGQNQKGETQNFTNGGGCFYVESGKKYFLFNKVKENYFDSTFLVFEKQNENDVIQGKWSPDSAYESGCITIRNSSAGNTSNENFVLSLSPGQSSGTNWRRKIDRSSLYLNLQNSAFEGTVSVSIFGRNQGSSEQNCTYHASSYKLRAGNKYFLFNSVHEDELEEARILFSEPSCNKQIEIRGYWSPDSISESGCIKITGSDSSDSYIPQNNFHGLNIEPAINADFLLNVPYISDQGIPSGCEGISATMLLQYFGFNIKATDFINSFLPRGSWSSNSAPDPKEAYIGNPYIKSGSDCGYGCYAECISKTINKVIAANNVSNALNSQAYSGKSIESLMNYVNARLPVLIWATMNMVPSSTNNTPTWTLNNGPRKGSKFTWIAHEHCLVLVGYNKTSYFFNDPYNSNGIIGFPKDVVNQRYQELGKQSVVIHKTQYLQDLECKKLLEFANKVLSSFNLSQEVKYLEFETPILSPMMTGTISVSIGDKMKLEGSGDLLGTIENGKFSICSKWKMLDMQLNLSQGLQKINVLNMASFDIPIYDLRNKLDQIALSIGSGNVHFSYTGDRYFKISITNSVPILASNNFKYTRVVTIIIKYKYIGPPPSPQTSRAPVTGVVPNVDLLTNPSTYITVGIIALVGVAAVASVPAEAATGVATLAAVAVGSVLSFFTQN